MARRNLLLALANLLIPVAILVFATGFFPYKPFMPGLAQYEDLMPFTKGHESRKQPEAPFDKLVFMVVDALRSDFVYGPESGMTFVQSLIRAGTALPFTAHATSPTITMPRVKAITTGSIPSFVDVILNFAESDTSSTLATQDTWLAQLNAKRFASSGETGRLIMYGDDTWLKLFPDFFARADGTSSFFVSVSSLLGDFTEVDNNVTRHVPGELRVSDWNAMILHYLGLDHIGHKAGPRSPNMVPKQKEMDGMVRTIYEAMENQDHLSNTLFVLCGDHGMNDGGNHGGSSPGETSPALVFMSPKLHQVTRNTKRESPTKPKTENEFDYYDMVEQSDIAPTLAGLMGFPVPKNNLGVFLDRFLGLWDEPADRTRLLHQNAMQMKKIVEATYTGLSFDDEVRSVEEMGLDCFGMDISKFSDGEELACLWQRVIASTTDEKDTVDCTYKFMRKAQETMSGAASNYNVSRLFLGTVISLLISILSFCTLPSFLPLTSAGLYTAFIILLYGILMFASSYVEEEHNFWYWATSGWFAMLFLSSMRKDWYSAWMFHPALIALAVHRIIRRWNQTGQKYAGADDIANSGIFHGNNSFILWAMIGITYMHTANCLAQHVARSIGTFDTEERQQRRGRKGEIEVVDQNRLVSTIAVMPLCGTAFIFKLAFTTKDAPELTQGLAISLLEWVETANLVGLAQMVFGGIMLSGVWIGWAEWQRAKMRKKRGGRGNGDFAVTVFDLTTLFLLTQTKAHHIPLFLLFRLQYFLLSHLPLTPTAITLTTLLLSQTSFFALGNSNGISSIDLSNAYNGISSYSIPLVSLLVFLSNWSGPVYWNVAALLLHSAHNADGTSRRHINPSQPRVPDWVAQEREALNRQARAKQERLPTEAGARGSTERWVSHVALMTFWTGAMLSAVMAGCMVLRQHLFIWTVFSPKFLFAMAWGVAVQGGVTVGMGGLVWWVGGW